MWKITTRTETLIKHSDDYTTLKQQIPKSYLDNL